MNATDRFDRCFQAVFGWEHGPSSWSGFVNNPMDPGGATQDGITLKTLSAHLGRPATITELKLMPMDMKRSIYRTGFWNAVRGDDLFSGVDLIVYDAAVMSGPGHAVRWLQEALGVGVDGTIGVNTLRALADASDRMVVEDIRQQRETYFRGLPGFAHDGAGWLRRLDSIAQTATGWCEPRSSAAVDPATMAAVEAAISSRAAKA